MSDVARNCDVAQSRSWIRRDGIKYIWALLLGFAGLVDLLGCVLPEISATNDTCDADEEQCEIATLAWNVRWQSLIHWFDRHDILISFIFSALWFLDAFLTAKRARREALEIQEYERLKVSKSKDVPSVHWLQNPQVVYFCSMTFQLLLLPVGFYEILHVVLHGMANDGSMDQVKNDVWNVIEIGEDGEEHHEQFSVRSKKAFIFVILQHFAGTSIHSILQSIVQYIKSKAIEWAKTLTKRTFSEVIHHPLKFRRQLKKVLKLVRYVMYGLPLVGKFNRILGLLTLAWKRQRQRVEAQRAKRTRQLLWESKPPKVRETDAAILVQSAFRSRQARKAVKALRIFRSDKEFLAISKIQHILRRKLRERREHLEAQKKELKRLEQQEGQSLSDKDKLRMYQLRHELLKETKVLLNRKMLMRPNTKFAVYWKFFFAICLIWELSKDAVKPLLQKPKSKSKSRHGKGAPKTVEELIAQKFVPTRISDWKECKIDNQEHGLLYRLSHREGSDQENNNGYKSDSAVESLPWYCKEPFPSTQESLRDVLALALIPKPVSEWSECSQDTSAARNKFFLFRRKQKVPEILELEWYCGKPFPVLHQVYRNVVDLFWSDFLVMVGVTYFLDVFVTFFTGEFDSKNGILVPKPFFNRWVLPGIFLQVAVNPYLKTVSGWIFAFLTQVKRLGPVRVFRWNATISFPLLFFAWTKVLLPLWLGFVEFENKHRLILPDA